VPLRGVELPRVELPMALDIVRHPRELRTKSTALHAKVLAGGERVRIAEVPGIDALGKFDPENTLLLYPSPAACTIEELGDSVSKYTKIVVVDSTWQQAASVLRHESLANLKHIRLASTYNTAFWRHQLKGDDHLATIEAIYYFFRERHEILNKGSYDGRYDNLLYLFAGMLRLIEQKKEQLEKTEGKSQASSSSSS